MTNSIRYVIGIDPSGNFFEGKGTTGVAVYDRLEDKIIMTGAIESKRFDRFEHYWQEHICVIGEIAQDFIDFHEGWCISIEDYLLYAGERGKAQTFSTMETPQLLGWLKMSFWHYGWEYYIRPAAKVKSRWNEEVLARKGYLRKDGKHWRSCVDNHILATHECDAIKHAVHCGIFDLRDRSIQDVK